VTYGHKIIIGYFFHPIRNVCFYGDYQLGRKTANLAGSDSMAFDRDYRWNMGSIFETSRHA